MEAKIVKPNYVLFVLMAVLLLGGCYESNVPLTNMPSLQTDSRLIKSWISVPKEDEKKAISLVIRKFNKREFLAAWKNGDDGVTAIARGFVTRINNVNIVNLQNILSLKKNERTYVFFKYNFNKNGNLVVNILSDDYAKLKDKKFESSNDFHDFVQSNITQEGLFEGNIEFKPTKRISFEIIHNKQK